MKMTLIGVLLVGFMLGVVSSVILVVFTLWKLARVVPMDPKERALADKEQMVMESERSGEPSGYRDLKAAEFFEKQDMGLKATYSGWLTVTPEFYKFPQINSDEFTKKVDNDDTNLSGVTNIFKAKKGKGNQEAEDPSTKTANQLNKIRKKYRFFSVLKHGNLFLYTDESKTNSKAVIVLSRHLVMMWPRTLGDSQLFTKSSAICLLNTEKLTTAQIYNLVFESNETTIPPENSYFLYSDTHSEKEDIYLALLRASKRQDAKPSFTEKDLFDPSFKAKTLHFGTADINNLIQTLNSTEGQLTTKWLNAFIGRYFLAVYHTPEFEAKCVEFVEKRLRKIRMPGFLDNLQIQRIHVGHGAPFITNPRLEKMSPEGDLDIIANILYQGGCILEISTKLFLNITGFKQREFDVILKITVKKICGDILFRIKKQPSNRVWYGFTKSPEMSLDIEPVFSSRALTYSIVTNIIQTKFREAINQSLVMPFMDNIAFYDTSNEMFRAGIWEAENQRASSGNLNEPIENPNTIPPPLPIRGFDTHDAKPSDTDDVLHAGSNKGNSTAISSKSATLSHRSSMRSQNNGQNSINDSLIETVTSNKSEIDLEHSSSLINEQHLQDSSRANTLSTAIQEKKIKQKVSNSYSMLKQWYNKKMPSSPSSSNIPTEDIEVRDDSQKEELIYGASHQIGTVPSVLEVPVSWNSTSSRTLNDSSKKAPYNPPEMISNRRKRQPRGSITSSISTPNIDTFDVSEDRRATKQDDPNMLIPSSPASPQMFINDKFKQENSDAIHGQIISRKSSGSFNIYTGASEANGFPIFDDDQAVSDTFALRRSSFGGDSNSIKQHSENLQQAVTTKPIRSELEKVPTTIDEVNELEVQNPISQHNSLNSKRKPPPLPSRDAIYNTQQQ